MLATDCAAARRGEEGVVRADAPLPPAPAAPPHLDSEPQPPQQAAALGCEAPPLLRGPPLRRQLQLHRGGPRALVGGRGARTGRRSAATARAAAAAQTPPGTRLAKATVSPAPRLVAPAWRGPPQLPLPRSGADALPARHEACELGDGQVDDGESRRTPLLQGERVAAALGKGRVLGQGGVWWRGAASVPSAQGLRGPRAAAHLT